jgi:hypothetical protein
VPESDVILEADGLRVVFFRRGDRYAHRFEVFNADRGEWAAHCESLEGEPGDEWPPSPPFQQVHVEQRPTGPVVLLIGMAGRSHWSAAVEVSADRRVILFDVAARMQELPSETDDVSSEYRYCRDGDGWLTPQVRIAWSLGEPAKTAPATLTWKYSVSLRT